MWKIALPYSILHVIHFESVMIKGFCVTLLYVARSNACKYIITSYRLLTCHRQRRTSFSFIFIAVLQKTIHATVTRKLCFLSQSGQKHAIITCYVLRVTCYSVWTALYSNNLVFKLLLSISNKVATIKIQQSWANYTLTFNMITYQLRLQLFDKIL